MSPDILLSLFKEDLPKLTNSELIHKYYMSGAAFALDDTHQHKLREEVAAYFKLAFTDVFIVGSAKLGFSIKPERRFMPFGDKSDVDLTIISKDLFEQVWHELHLFQKSGGYWDLTSFKHYHFQGWIRPDKLPRVRSFRFTSDWWDFFNSFSKDGRCGRYRIRAGLYYSRFFFDSYQQICLDQCRQEITI